MSPPRRRRPRARLVLPPLSPREASLLVEILQRAESAVWRAHGYAITHYRAALDRDELGIANQPLPPDDQPIASNPHPDPDDEIDF